MTAYKASNMRGEPHRWRAQRRSRGCLQPPTAQRPAAPSMLPAATCGSQSSLPPPTPPALATTSPDRPALTPRDQCLTRSLKTRFCRCRIKGHSAVIRGLRDKFCFSAAMCAADRAKVFRKFEALPRCFLQSYGLVRTAPPPCLMLSWCLT